MDLTIIITLCFLYIICAWIISYNISSDLSFSLLEKRINHLFLFFPPVGIFLFIFLKIKNKNKKPIKKINKKKQFVYHGGYDGGHNKPLNNN